MFLCVISHWLWKHFNFTDDDEVVCPEDELQNAKSEYSIRISAKMYNCKRRILYFTADVPVTEGDCAILLMILIYRKHIRIKKNLGNLKSSVINKL